MTRARRTGPLRSDMGWFDVASITVRGIDLCKGLLGKVDLGEFAFLEIMGRLPTQGESVVFNAMLGSLVEHGMTPMALSSRLTYLGAPESLQGAVAAGILGMGSLYAGTAEGAARILQGSAGNGHAERPVDQVADDVVRDHVVQRRQIPGIGHPIHKPIDPRVPRLFELAAGHGLAGRHVALMQAISRSAEKALGRPGQLPVNATGAIGALASELGIPWRVCRGLAVIGRCVGLVGHLAEELRDPIAMEVLQRTEEECTSHHR